LRRQVNLRGIVRIAAEAGNAQQIVQVTAEILGMGARSRSRASSVPTASCVVSSYVATEVFSGFPCERRHSHSPTSIDDQSQEPSTPDSRARAVSDRPRRHDERPSVRRSLQTTRLFA
ncbi:MAG: hypothetical protein ACXVCX_19175, partial [Ktedonobacterales bacterium]